MNYIWYFLVFVITCLHFFLYYFIACSSVWDAVLCFSCFQQDFYFFGVVNYVLPILLSFHCFTGFDHSFMGWDHITKSWPLLVYLAFAFVSTALMRYLVWRIFQQGMGVGWLVSLVFFLVFIVISYWVLRNWGWLLVSACIGIKITTINESRMGFEFT